METITQQQTMFKIKSVILFDLIKVIKEFQTEIKLKFTSDGLEGIFICPANVSLMEFKIDKYNFVQYEGSIEIGLNPTDLYKALKDNKKGFVTLEILGTKLNLSFDNGIKTTINLLDISDMETRKTPDLSFNSFITINSKKFKEICKNAANMNESLNIGILNNNAVFKAFNKETSNNFEIMLSNDEAVIKGYEYKSAYSLEYLNKFLKVLFSEDINLSFDNDYPLQIDCKGVINIKFILAPRIEQD